MQIHRFIRLGMLALCAMLLWPASCATNPVTGTRELMLLSEADEIRLGQHTDSQIAKTYGLYDDAALGTYIQDLGKRVARHSHRPYLHYDFKIVDSPTVNAFAVPGGYVYVTRGILAYLNSEAELAGVIGHEIGHIAARHSAQQYSRAQLAQLGFGVGAILSETFRGYADLAQFGVGMLFLKFSRDNERQADDLGVEYATKAGFDASQLAGFFTTLERLHPSSDKSGLPGWFSTHPNPPERVRAVHNRVHQWTMRLGGHPLLHVNREAYLKRIDGLVFGEDPRQGFVADGVFYHPDQKFQFPLPTGWKLQNSPSQVSIMSPRKDAAILFSLTPEPSAKTAARKFVTDTRSQVIETESISVNGLAAQRMISDITSQQGTIRILSYFIEKNGVVYVFHALSDYSVFQTYTAAFAHTLHGFRELTDPKRLHVMPEHLRIRATKTTGTLRQVLKAMGVSDKRLEETALLNGKDLAAHILAGSHVKIVSR